MTLELPLLLPLVILNLLGRGEYGARGAALELQTLWVMQWYCREQGSAQQPGAQAGLAPRHAAQPHDHPDSEQQQDIRDEDWFMFWVMSPQRTSVIHIATGNHIDVYGPGCHQKP